MASLNKKQVAEKIYTHEGAVATQVSDFLQLQRSVLSCMLWENTFYEDGVEIGKRISDLVDKCKAEKVEQLALFAREEMKLRHVPLLLERALARSGRMTAEGLAAVIQRPDELTEFLAIYWKDKKQPLSAQVKKGLAKAFTKFNAYQLAKYNRDAAIKLRDVLFLTHAKPLNAAMEKTWKQLVDGTLASPDTWEVALSSGADKKETFTRLLEEGKLGALAYLRNLRNMHEAGVSKSLIELYANALDVERVLPFRFLSAAKVNPWAESFLEPLMLKCLEGQEKLPGKTVLVIDTSGSMSGGMVSAKSDLSRIDAAKALAILARELCEDVQIYATAGNDMARKHATMLIPSRRGFALGEAIFNHSVHSKIGGGGIFLQQCMDYIDTQEQDVDRVIVFTDEQDCDNKGNPKNAKTVGKNAYIINVANYKNGIGYGRWNHIDGWSEAVFDFIRLYEKVKI